MSRIISESMAGLNTFADILLMQIHERLRTYQPESDRFYSKITNGNVVLLFPKLLRENHN